MNLMMAAQPQAMTIVLQKFEGGGVAFAVAYDGKIPEGGSMACRSTLAEVMEQFVHAGARGYFKEEPLVYRPVPSLPYHQPQQREQHEFQTHGSGVAPDMPDFMNKPSDLDGEQRGLIQQGIDKLKGSKNGGAHLSVVLACMFALQVTGRLLGA